MLKAFFKLNIYMNPDITIGYNIFGFDYEFIYRRAQETGCEDEFMNLTRNMGESSLVSKRNDGISYTDIENTKVALASGEYDLRYPKMTGRIQIDMLMYCRREFQWSSYKLDDVASQNISDDIKHIETCVSDNETKLYSQNLMGLHVGDFIHLEIVGFSSDYYGNGQKFKVKDIQQNIEYETGKKSNMIVIEGAHVISVGKKKIKWGMAKDDVTPQDIFRLSNGSSADRAIVAKYCIQDCILVNKLLHKLKIIENNIGMGNVCLVPLNYLFRRGQGIKIFSLISNECMKKDYLIPVIKNYISDEDVEGYEGAIVLEPQEGIYLDEPIVVFDYGSLYPSSMICRNLSHDTYITDDKYLKENDDYEVIKVSYDLYEGTGDKKIKTGIKECNFAKYKNGDKGIIPSILEMLLNERKNTRKKIEYNTIITNDDKTIIGFIDNETDDLMTIIDVDLNKKTTIKKKEIKETKITYNKFECAVFDALQNAYKITANSLYGQIGARTSPIYLKEIAACTTSTGREMIMLAKNFVETNYKAEVIYGDTDSIFCRFDVGNKEGKEALQTSIDIGIEVETKIKKHLPYPQKLNYEKCLFPFILFTKKRYVGNLYEKDVNKYKQKSMGIVLKRRDNANIVKKIYGGIIDIILNSQDIELSIKFLREELNDLVDFHAYSITF